MWSFHYGIFLDKYTKMVQDEYAGDSDGDTYLISELKDPILDKMPIFISNAFSIFQEKLFLTLSRKRLYEVYGKTRKLEYWNFNATHYCLFQAVKAVPVSVLSLQWNTWSVKLSTENVSTRDAVCLIQCLPSECIGSLGSDI